MRLGKYLLVGALAVLIVSGAIWFWLLHTESGASFAWTRVESAMAKELSGDFVRGNFSDGMELTNLRFSTEAVEISVRSVRAAADIDLFPVQANISAVHLHGVAIESKPAESDANDDLDVGEILAALRLPIRVNLADARVDEIEISAAAGDAFKIDRLDASAFWHDSVVLRQLQASLGDNKAGVQGSIQLSPPQSINLSADVLYDDIALKSRIIGDQDSARLIDLVVNGADIEARGSALLIWAEEISAEASVQIKRLDPAAYTDAWPESHPVTGALNVAMNEEQISISDANVAVMNSDANLQFDAIFDRIAATVAADLSWVSLQWPIDTAAPNVRSTDGSVLLSGDLATWTIDGTVAVGTAEMPDGRFQINGGGDEDHVALTIEEGSVFGGTISGETEYSWRDEQQWSASLDFSTLDTSGVLPDWPAKVSGYASANGTVAPFAIAATLRDVSGDIRGESLAADGAIKYSDGITSADKLVISHGTSEFLLDGSADTTSGLVFSGSVGAIESYLDTVAGGFEASGRLSTLADQPYLSVNMNSDEIRIGDVVLQGLQVTDARPDDAIAGFVVQVGQLYGAGQNVVDIELQTTVTSTRQILALTGINRDSAFGITVDGAFDDLQSVAESSWRGNVTSFSVDLQDRHSLHLENPAAVEISPEHMTLDAFCLADEESIRLCVDLARDSDGGLDLTAHLLEVPLSVLEHVLDTGLILDQHISGSIEWAADPERGASGTGELALSAGAIAARDNPSLSVPTGAGQLSFDISDGDLLSGTAAIPLPGVGGFAADFKILDLSQAAASGVGGHLNIEMTDIALAALLIPQLDAASGRLTADLDLAGTVDNPLLTGKAGLEDGVIEYGPIGLRLDEINLDGKLTANRAVELSGRFRSGDGYGAVISSADYRDRQQPGIRFKIHGDELQLVNVPDIQLKAKPDLEIAYDGATLEINGSILIPSARIAPSNLAENRIRESDDVLIVAGRLSETAAAEEPESDLIFDGLLEIELGNDIIIDLDIAKASLTGSATFDWQGSSMPVVNGRYDLGGSVQIFGQVLEIAEGGIRYANAPADEPYLRINAEREIYGNSTVKRAGVLVEGIVSRLNIDPYTVPMTTEERALTLLVTGSDFDYEQGVGAVDFGTYIAPRLFVSYGVGIFDRENIISARYDLARGFGVKASSGTKASGLDLNYRFEN